MKMFENIKVRIEEELKVLLGQPLIDLGRASNLLWLNFGEKVLILDRNNCERIHYKYGINIQCSWRITTEDRIVVASRDIYLPRTGLKNDENFDWEQKGNNKFDERIDEFKKEFKSNLVISRLSADQFGGLKIYFDSDINLEIFPDDSFQEEFWRFMVYEGKSKHFVVFDED